MPGAARGAYTPEDFIVAARVVFRKSIVRRFVMGALAAALSLLVLIGTGQAAPMVLSAAVCFAFIYDYFLGQPVRIRRRVRGTPGMSAAVEIAWSADGLSSKDATGSGTQSWTAYSRAIELAGAFILLLHSGLYVVIPKRWLGSFEAEADLRATIEPLLTAPKR